MKTLAISNVAWVATVRSFVDGDVFRESNIDLSMGDVADRLGYLKAQVDGAGKLTGDQTWTGDNEFVTSAGHGFSVSGNQNVILTGSVGLVGNFASFSGSITTSDTALGLQAARADLQGKVLLSDIATLADANGVSIASTVANVPQITNNRSYACPVGAADDGRLVILSRRRTADAFTVTLTDPSAGTLGVIPASQAGWIVAQYRLGTADWVPVLWSSNITSLLATV